MFSKSAATMALSLSLTLAIGMTCLPSPSFADESGRKEKAARRSSIVATAASAGTFRTLVNALVAADLVETLKEDGPFTVFAPTDEAFAKLAPADVAALLKPENKDSLRKLLTLHVIAGSLTAEVLASHGSPKTLSGSKLTVAANRHGLAINEATVIKADIVCGNGIIHVIDRVLMPAASTTDLLGVAQGKKSFKVLTAAVKAAGLEDVLRGDGPFTVLAPTDEAFARIPKDKLDSLLLPENKGKLAEILKFHVISGKLTARQVVSAGKAKTLQGGSVVAAIEDGRLTLNGVKVVATDIKADNGIIHAIDSVLIPE